MRGDQGNKGAINVDIESEIFNYLFICYLFADLVLGFLLIQEQFASFSFKNVEFL